MEGRKDLPVQTVAFKVKIESAALGKGQLVAKEIDIQPVFGMAAQFGPDHVPIKFAGGP